MVSDLILTTALSALLIGGGLVLVIAESRTRRTAVSNRIDLITPTGVVAGTSDQGDIHGPGASLMRTPAGRLNQAELREILRPCRRLGIAPRHAPQVYMWWRGGMAAIAALIAVAVARAVAQTPPGTLLILVAAIFAGIGWIGSRMVVEHLVARHTQAVVAGLPEALELMVVCVEAGLSLEDSIDRVTGELKWSRPALAEELSLTSADLKILADRDIALSNLAERVDAPSVRSVVVALSQTLRYGTPLAQALRVTSAELRNDALVRMEERANRLPPLLTVPMMLFILPTIFLIIGGPAVLRLMDVFGD